MLNQTCFSHTRKSLLNVPIAYSIGKTTSSSRWSPSCLMSFSKRELKLYSCNLRTKLEKRKKLDEWSVPPTPRRLQKQQAKNWKHWGEEVLCFKLLWGTEKMEILWSYLSSSPFCLSASLPNFFLFFCSLPPNGTEEPVKISIANLIKSNSKGNKDKIRTKACT